MLVALNLIPVAIHKPCGMIGILRIDRLYLKQPRRLRKKIPVDQSEGQADDVIQTPGRHRLITMKCFAAEDFVRIDGKVIIAATYPEFVEALYAREEFPEPPKHWKTTAAKAKA